MSKAELAREYRERYGVDMPTRKLGRIMYNQNKLLFKDTEDARNVLRRIEGKSGKARKGGGGICKVTHPHDARPCNPYKLPDSDESVYEPHVINGYKKIAIFCDVHVPYYSQSALTAAIGYAKKRKVDLCILDGDFFDFHGLSKYLKDPKKRKFGEEIAMGIEVLNIIQKQLKCKLIYKLGNHCERLEHFLWQKWGELEQLADLEEIKEITLENIIRRRSPQLDIEFIGEKRIIQAGALDILHGHEFQSSVMSPVNIARGLYLRAKRSSMCGHHHRTSEHTEVNTRNEITTTFSVGCLSELHPSYMPLNSWNHGMAIIELDGKNFQVDNKRIYNGKIL